MAPTKDRIEDQIKHLPRADMQEVCAALLERIEALEGAKAPKSEKVKPAMEEISARV